jgi:hypothetical protein
MTEYERMEIEYASHYARSLDRRAARERRRRSRLRLRALFLLPAVAGFWLIGAQVFKTEGLPTWPLVFIGIVLVVPFISTFGEE